MTKISFFSKVLFQIMFFFYVDIKQYATCDIFCLLPQGNRYLRENHKSLIIKYMAYEKVVLAIGDNLLTQLPIWNLHSLRDLNFKATITFLLLVRFLSNFHQSVLLIFSFPTQHFMTKVGFPFNILWTHCALFFPAALINWSSEKHTRVSEENI